MTVFEYSNNVSNYRVKTFDSQATQNYIAAIQYYRAKFQILFQQLSKNVKSKFAINADYDLEYLFNHCADSFLFDWEKLYNSKKVNYEVMKKTVDQLQQYVQRDNAGRAARIDYLLFINKLAENAGLDSNVFQNVDNIPQYLDLSSLAKIWNKIEKGQNTSIPNLMGEIFEQGVTGILQNSLDGLFAKIEQTGSAYAKGKKVKPDALLSISDFTVKDASIKSGKKTVRNNEIDIGGNSFRFEVENLIDLENPMTDLQSILNQSYPGLIGMTAKQWTDQAGYKSIAKFKIPTDTIFSKEELNNFQPTTLRLYNVWIISRYLISILGSLNVIVASGSHIQTTDAFLSSLLSQNRAIIMQKRTELLAGSGSLNIGPRYV